MDDSIRKQLKEIDRLDLDDENKLLKKADIVYSDDDIALSLILEAGKKYGFVYISHLMDFLKLNDPYLFIKARKRTNYQTLKACYPVYKPKKYSPSRRMYKDCFELMLDESKDHDIIEYIKSINGEERQEQIKSAIRKQMKSEGAATVAFNKEDLIEWD